MVLLKNAMDVNKQGIIMKKYLLMIFLSSIFVYGHLVPMNQSAQQANAELDTYLHTLTMQQRQRNAAIKKARQRKIEQFKQWKYASVGLAGAFIVAQINPKFCAENWHLLCILGLAVNTYFQVF